METRYSSFPHQHKNMLGAPWWQLPTVNFSTGIILQVQHWLNNKCYINTVLENILCYWLYLRLWSDIVLCVDLAQADNLCEKHDVNCIETLTM